MRLIYEVKGINMNKNNLDEGIGKDEPNKNDWRIEDGITPDWINQICLKIEYFSLCV